MPVYRVMLSGERVAVKTETGLEVCGFVRNEYVRAHSTEDAIEKAKQRVHDRISKHPAISLLLDSPFQLAVDEVEKGVALWKLARNESFVFFPSTNQ